MNSRELLDIVRAVKPNALFGFSTIGGAFSEAVLKEMTVINQTPIVFALSNPTSKAECTAEQCYRYTNVILLISTFDKGLTLLTNLAKQKYDFSIHHETLITG